MQKETKMVILKTIVRNKGGNNNYKILKTYLNKWRDVIKSDRPRLDELTKRITKVNILKNGPEFLDKLNKNRIYNKKISLLLKLIPKKTKNQKIILYKYLLRWRNKVYGINSSNLTITYGKKMIGILLNKNDKQNILKAFNKWRYIKDGKVPVNAYLAAIKKIRKVICKGPFKKFVDKMDKTNPQKLRPKGQKIEIIIKKISKSKPFLKFIKNIKMIIRVNQLKKIQPKVHDIIKKYYLQKYLNRWKNIVKDQRLKNMKIITKWLKKKYDIEKERKRKRRSELLKRIINNLIKEDKHKLKFPLHFWKRISTIYTDNDNARIIQNFCRQILLKIQKKKLDDQKKLTDLIINLYKKTIIKTVTDHNDVGQVNKYINTKKENTNKLKNIFTNRDKNNNKLLLRLALLKWNEGKDKYDKSIQIIQNKIRQLISKNKLNDKKLLINILKHIIKSNENKNKNLLRNKFLQWYAIAKKLNYHDTSKIEEFIRKIVVERLRRKLQTILNRYSTKYFVYLLTNIAKINKLKNTLRKEPTKDAFDKIRKYIRKRNIKKTLKIIVEVKDDKLRTILLREYLNKWRNKIKEIKDKENKSIVIIQKVIRGRKVKNEVDKDKKIKKILTQIIYRYDQLSPLNLYFAKWKRITRKIICDENSRIIQNFCRTIHNEYLKRLKDKNDVIYKKLVNVISKLGKNPKRDFFDRLYKLYKIKKLEKILNDLAKKRRDILKDTFDKIKKSTKLTVLRNTLNVTNNQKNRILKKYLIKWRNKALSNKYIVLYLTKFINKKINTKDNILRSTLYTWLYRAHFRVIKENEKIISEFCKDIRRKIYIIKRWHELSNKLRKVERGCDIYEIYNKLKIVIGLRKFTDYLKRKYRKQILDKLKGIKNKSTFKKNIKIIIEKVENNTNEISIKKYFDKWRNTAKKMKERLDKLNELMIILGIRQKKNDVNTINDAMLKHKLTKKLDDDKIKNKKLADDLLRTRNDLNNKRESLIIKKIYKVYTYKVFDKIFKTLGNKITKTSKYLFLKKIILNYSTKTKEFTYSNHIQNENKPYTKKILFKTKKKTQTKTTPDKSQIYLSLTSVLVKLVNDLIQKRKKDTLNTIKKKYISIKFTKAFEKYVKDKSKPNFQDFIERFKVLIDMYENDGPQQAKLFTFLRKVVIKKLFIYKEEIYRINKLFYLLNLTMFNIEMARIRWIRQMIRKW